ncbi:hypothetical protein B0H14DRAFT_2628317 [Mycena olivaceomarginata]|nr:hypothetical protein B0H14DRAFT_2628317 [Mycena olivaceomarginata]
MNAGQHCPRASFGRLGARRLMGQGDDGTGMECKQERVSSPLVGSAAGNCLDRVAEVRESLAARCRKMSCNAIKGQLAGEGWETVKVCSPINGLGGNYVHCGVNSSSKNMSFIWPDLGNRLNKQIFTPLLGLGSGSEQGGLSAALAGDLGGPPWDFRVWGSFSGGLSRGKGILLMS